MKLQITAQLTDLGTEDPVTLINAKRVCRDFDSSVSLDEIMAWIGTETEENTIAVLNHCEFFVITDEVQF